MSQLLQADAVRTAVEIVDPSLADRVRVAVDRAATALFAKQEPDGHLCAELEGDSILSSEFLLMRVALGQDDEDPALHHKLCAHLRALQRSDGTWGQYPGSPPDLSATVKGYFALKLFGNDRDEPHMRAAREAVLGLGGAEQCNTFSTFYLACLGQVSWDACPTIPPEMVLVPKWFPFHLNKCASWTRTLIVPLAICSALRPVRRLPSVRGIGELFRDHAAKDVLYQRRADPEPGSWAWGFLEIDRLLKLYHRAGVTPGRDMALRACVRWIDERADASVCDGLGAIFPPLVYIQIAYQALGLDRTNATRAQCEREIARWVVQTDDHARIQPCFSAVWDTGIALYAVTETGRTAANDEPVARTCDWLRAREVRVVGDWLDNMRPRDRDVTLGPGGNCAAWAFEYRNEWSPDVDDTAMVAKALWRAGDRPDETANRDAARRAVEWILRMQNDDGGWAAFDRTQDRPWMEAIPFADHNAMQDPSCADITGRTLEALVTCGVPRDHPSVRAAVGYLLDQQEGFGAWYGRWGVNYLYGTWQAVGGLTHAGVEPHSNTLRRAAAWLRSVQADSGGWGESANSYLPARDLPKHEDPEHEDKRAAGASPRTSAPPPPTPDGSPGLIAGAAPPRHTAGAGPARMAIA
ncbi:MAG: squalene--hopene cyclase, partial [Planctomycetota bacterium]